MKRKLAIITEIIAPYRVPVFNALAKKKDIDLHVIFLSENDPTQRDWLIYKEEIGFSYEVLRNWRKRIGGYHILLNSGIERALLNAAPDVILCGGYNYLASWSALAWAKKNGVEFLLWIESTALDLRSRWPWAESLKVKFLRQCDGFAVPGQASRDYLLSYGVNGSAVFMTPNAVDNQRFAQFARHTRNEADAYRALLSLPPRYFLFCGRLVMAKGVFDLLDAYRRLTPEVRKAVGLVFVGAGREQKKLALQAQRIVPGKVLFPGFAQRDQLASYYALADTLVFPTHTDPWGLVVNEAMACSLPVVGSTAAGCTADLIQDKWNGLKVEAGNVEQLTAAMEKLARDPALATLMGERSAERIQQYSPEAWADGVENAFSQRARCAA